MEWESKTSVRVFTLALVCLVAVGYPLLAGAGPVNTRGGGDSPFLFVRLEQLVAGLRAGAFPVRWMPDAAYGLGYPFFNFYAALPYYLAAGLRLLGWGPIHALQAVQALGFVLSAAAMALLARRVFRRPAAVALAVVAYTCAPFHLVNVYVRGDSLSEFYAFIFYPLILWALHRLRHRPTLAGMAWLGLSYGGLILTHNLSAVIFTPFAGLYALGLLIGRRPIKDVAGEEARASRQIVLLMAGGILLGLALSATLWLVAAADLGRVWMGFKDIQTEGFFNYAGQFRGRDLIQGSLLFDYQIGAGHTPFAMGLIQAAIILGGAGTAVAAWWRSRTWSPIWIWLGGLLLSTLLITPLSRPLWDYLPVLPIVQFPWRFLSVQALFGALLSAELAERLPRPWWIAAAGTALLLAAAVVGLRPEYLPIRDVDVTGERLALFELFTTNIGTTIRGEYLPAAVEPRPYASAVTLSRAQRPPPTALVGTLAQATPVRRDANSEHWRVSVTSPEALLGFHTLYFAGWRATLDGRPIEIAPLPGSGLTSLRLPEGTHDVILRFGRTPARWAADLISLLAGVGMLILLWPRRAWLAGPRLKLVGLALAAGMIVVAALTLAENVYQARTDAARADDLSMDFDHMPFLHHNPDGIPFGPVRLTRYAYADRVHVGDTLAATLHWSAPAPDVQARLALVSPAAVHPDLQPAPQPLAQEQASIVDSTTTYSLAVPQDTMAGLYYLSLRVWEGESELRPANEQGEPLGTTYLRPVWVENAQPATGQEPVQARFENLWLGKDVRVTADESGWEIQLPWLPIHPLAANYSYSLRLLSAAGTELAGRDIEGGGGYGFWPTSTWQAGHWLTDRLRLAAPAGVRPADAAALRVVLYDRSQPDWPAAAAVTVPLVERAHSYQAPAMEHLVGAVYGEQMELLGYDVTQRDGDSLHMRLYWQAVGPLAGDWTVFVHLLDADGQIVSQWDAQPLGGVYPTSWWREGEVVVDEITLALDRVSPGSYRPAVGLYDPLTWARLPVTAPGAEAGDGRLLLEAVLVSK